MPFDEEELDPHGECAVEIKRLQAEVESKSEQIGKLYKVCNERDVLKNLLGRARHHIEAALSLTEDNRLALAVQGRSMVRQIDAAIVPQQITPCAQDHSKYVGKCPYCHEVLK